MDLLTLVVLGIALVNLAVFAAGCTLAIVRTRDELRRTGGRSFDAAPIARALAARRRATH
ncbi:MAG: hypothetical protein ACLGIJ_01825 [Candidatus Limnocylindria bacterium]